MTCASEVTGTASPANANENKITEEARRIPIPSRLSIVIASLRAKCREIKAHLMIVDRSPEPAFVARTASRVMRGLQALQTRNHRDVHAVALSDGGQHFTGSAAPEGLSALIIAQLALAAEFDAGGHSALAD